MKTAVVLFNLGGPDGPAAVRPFLYNLFDDPAIVDAQPLVRHVLAWFLARRRAPVAREIYAKIGGRSPILEETEAQARALEEALGKAGHEAKCFIAMRYWHPFAGEAAAAVKAWKPERVVLLPLYPQFSTTTTASSFEAWRRAAAKVRLTAPASKICCYPFQDGFVGAIADRLLQTLQHSLHGRDRDYRILFSAHGLPRRIVERGDPYPGQVELTARAILDKVAVNYEGGRNLDSVVCYQSRVGPLEWIGPAIDKEIERAGKEGKGVIVVPVAFVSEHSETLVELDIEYLKLAREAGVPDYIRVRTVGTHPDFIRGLVGLVAASPIENHPVNCAGERICPENCVCGQSL